MDLQNEIDVVQEGRKNTLGDNVEASMEEKSSKKLIDKLREDNVGQLVVDMWVRESANLSEFLKRQEDQLDLLDNFSTATGEHNPFGGSSNLHIPMAFTVAKTYHARFVDSILGIDPPFSVKARREDGTDAIQTIEDLMRFTLQAWANRGNGIDEVVDHWVWNWCTTGTGIVKNRWLTEYERYIDVQKRYIPGKPKLVEDMTGRLVEVPTWITEEEEVERVERVQYCPQYDIVNVEDIVIVNGEGDPDRADAVIHRFYSNASELWTGVDRGIYDSEVVEEIIRGGGSNPLSPTDNGGMIKQLRNIKAGDQSFGTEGRDKYEMLEACMKYDVDGNGITTEVVVTVDRNTSQILKATYLRRIAKNGKRPYSIAHFHRRPGEAFGIGLLEILSPLARELDMMHNTRIDNVLFQSTPFFLYRRTAGVDPDSVVLEPGAGIPVTNPDDIFFPQLPNRTSFSAQEESVIYNYVERLTGISDLSLGVMSSTQGVTRTATGARALLGENNSNLSIHLRRLNRGFTRLLQNTWAMLKNKVEPGFTFRVIGDDGRDIFRKVNDVVMGVDVDFDISANSGNSNKAVQIEVGQFLMGMTQNPLFLQTGLSDPNKMYAAARHYMTALGIKDVHRFINRPVGYEYIPSPQEEFMRIISDQEVPVSPGMDHEKAIAFMSKIVELQQDPNLPPGSKLSDEQINKVQDQIKKHAEMMQALQMQQAQQANMMQQQINMQQGLTPGSGAPTYTNQENTFGQIF